MRLKRAIPIFTVAAAFGLGAVPVASAATDVQQASSENWAGYVVGGSGSSEQFKTVSGSWVVPTVTCASGQPSYSALWDGIGGADQVQALEQAGTEADCSSSGTASYFAWYELVPSAPVKVNMAVSPGDHVSSKVTVQGNNVTIALNNSTTGGSFTKTLQMSTTPDTSSAEWIAEAPSQCGQGLSNCSPLALADFGTAQFSGSSATTTDGHTGTISDPDWGGAAAVTLSPGASTTGFAGYDATGSGNTAGATPSALSSDGSSFSVTYNNDGSSSSDTSGSTGGATGSGYPGYGYGGGSGYPSDGSGSGYGYGYGGGYPGYSYGGGSGYGYGYGYGGGSGYGYSDGGGYYSIGF
jgi:hypothetical protein